MYVCKFETRACIILRVGEINIVFFFKFPLLVRQIEAHMHKHTYNKSIHIYQYKPHPFLNAINKNQIFQIGLNEKNALSVKSSYRNFYFPLFLNIINKKKAS